jgi:uncharacterized membrane protein
MTPARWLLLVRAALCAAVFACAALVIDYRNLADATFCGVESACFKVRSSSVGQEIAERIHEVIPGATLPAVTLPVFAGLLALTLFLSGKWMVRALAALTSAGALIALGLVYAQIKIDALCAYCMVVDVSMIVAAIGAVQIARAARSDDEAEEKLGPSLATRVTFPWAAAGALCTALPFLWAEFPDTEPLPPELAAMQQPGKLNVFSFTDFECPFCRQLYPTLKEIKQREDVAFHRFMVPLDGHKGAMPAALAYVCTAENQRDLIAETLYTVPAEQLSYESVVGLAVLITNADDLAFRKCMTSPEAKAKVEADKKLFDKLELSGLPTTIIGNRRIRGAAIDKVQTAVRTAGAGVELPVWIMLVLGAAVILGAAVLSSRRIEAAPAPEPEPEPEPEKPAEAAEEEASPAPRPKKAKKRKSS